MRKMLLALSALLLFASACWAQSNIPPSLAEAARKVRAQRAKKELAKTQVYTNEDLPKAVLPVSIIGRSAPAAAEGPEAEGETAVAQEGAAAQTEGSTKAAAKECDEPCWRAKFREQGERIRTAQQELDILQREYNLARTQYYQDPNQAMREQYSGTVAGGRQLQDLLNRINEKRAEIQRLQQELSDLEDELRRSGGKPGWVREQ